MTKNEFLPQVLDRLVLILLFTVAHQVS